MNLPLSDSWKSKLEALSPGLPERARDEYLKSALAQLDELEEKNSKHFRRDWKCSSRHARLLREGKLNEGQLVTAYKNCYVKALENRLSGGPAPAPSTPQTPKAAGENFHPIVEQSRRPAPTPAAAAPSTFEFCAIDFFEAAFGEDQLETLARNLKCDEAAIERRCERNLYAYGLEYPVKPAHDVLHARHGDRVEITGMARVERVAMQERIDALSKPAKAAKPAAKSKPGLTGLSRSISALRSEYGEPQ
jgi:hypothetical protein